jgi:hypothetical protein
MTQTEARAFITWFRNNHLPKGIDFVKTSSGRDILLDDLSDDDAVFVAAQFEYMFDKASGKHDSRRMM